MKKVKYILELSEETARKLDHIVEFKNMEISLESRNGSTIEPSDIIKAALADYLDLFYSIDKSSSILGINLQSSYVINNRFKKIADRKGMKQVDIINLTGINKTNLSQIFNNVYQPRIDAFIRIWVALECPPLDEVIYLERNQKGK